MVTLFIKPFCWAELFSGPPLSAESNRFETLADLHGDPQLPGISLVVLRLHLVEGEEPVEGELVVAGEGEVLLHHVPLLVRHLLPACPPVEQVELRPGRRDYLFPYAEQDVRKR